MDSIIPDQSYTAHQRLLEAAYHEHERVREEALLFLEKLRLEDDVAKEQNRLTLERRNRQLAEEAIALAQQSIPIPEQPVRVKTPPVKSPILQPVPKIASPALPPPPEPVPQHKPSTPLPPAPSFPLAARANGTVEPTREKTIPQNNGAPIAQSKSTITRSETPPALTQPVSSATQSSAHLLPGVAGDEIYLRIHQSLKQLRKEVVMESKADQMLKNKVGDMRRAIRTAVGQLTDVKGANRECLNKIINVLKESTTLRSRPVDPKLFMLSPPPSTGENDTIPSLTIYLLNIFAKVVIKQFIDEAGANQKAAEPIGVIAITVFGRKDFQYKDCSLIDILMAKMRVVCPTVFGIRGNDNTEAGRAAQGWHKDGGTWISEQAHNTRMTGLGAGYAAISLRDFSKTAMTNPWPPSYYWRSLAAIVSNPNPSGTQFLVVKAMIEGYEQKFLTFYGTAGRAALQAALVIFPGRDRNKTVASSSLKTLADKLRKDVGLVLVGSN